MSRIPRVIYICFFYFVFGSFFDLDALRCTGFCIIGTVTDCVNLGIILTHREPRRSNICSVAGVTCIAARNCILPQYSSFDFKKWMAHRQILALEMWSLYRSQTYSIHSSIIRFGYAHGFI